jgi:S-adenosylmethionine:tRNA ribosyltransferase-isomerase
LDRTTRIVLNDSAVAPSTLLLDGQRVAFGQDPETLHWHALGDAAQVVHPHLQASPEGIAVPQDAAIRLLREGQVTWPRYLDHHRADSTDGVPSWYDTSYARHPGSVAPPSGGLNLTPEILGNLTERGHHMTHLTHHVGAVTFRQPHHPDLRQHEMAGERFFIRGPAAHEILDSRDAGERILAVGTTTTRALEYSALHGGLARRWQTGVADIFIRPGHKFQAVDALLTGLHGPKTTLLVLVCAFGGRRNVLNAYRQALKRGYRWYTLGDSMLIL